MPLDEKMNLDVGRPDLVPIVLSRVVDKYNESAGELASAWQDKHAGKEWAKIAKILDRANAQIREYLAAQGYTQYSDG